jgi:la-related protein 6
MFHQYGEILLVRVIKPGKILPFDLKQFANKIHDLGTTPCAIVEFELANSAKSAVEKEKKGSNVRLALLQPDAFEHLYPENQSASSSDSERHSHNESGIEVISDHGDHSSQDGSVNVVRMNSEGKKSAADSDSDSSKKSTRTNSSGSQEKLVGNKTVLPVKSKRSASVPHIPRTCGWPVIGAPMTTIPTMIVPQVYATPQTQCLTGASPKVQFIS